MVNQQFTFNIDDYNAAGDVALKLIQDKVFKNTTSLTPAASTTKKKLKIETKVYKGGTLQLTFWGVLSAQYSTSGIAGFGQYQVSIVNSGE
jgi:hypothetical protein